MTLPPGKTPRDSVFRRKGRNERLTDEFPAKIVNGILSWSICLGHISIENYSDYPTFFISVSMA